MIAKHLRQLSLLLLAIVLAGIAFFQMFERVYSTVPPRFVAILTVVAALFIVLWGLLLKFQPYASQGILPCVLLLTAIGTMMIARIDYADHTSVAFRQLVWVCIALLLTCALIVALRDYRVLRRFSYVSMVVGILLLLSPMIPGLGKEIGGARIWIGFGSHTLQPGEFAKLFLAFFFAAYLFDHRDQLAVGGKKVLGLQLPRIRDLGPIIIVWFASIGVLVIQHDLGTSLMFFAMFVSMLYVATGRGSWLIIGGIAFALAAVVSVKVFAHVGYRVDGWLHPFDPSVYNRSAGSSYQLVTGLFGLAAGGLLGTGLGQGHPGLTPLANSDFIYASLGEELGLTGLLAILGLYLIIITSGIVTAMKIKDGFGKLLASGLAFTMAFQVFTVVGGITLVIPMTGLTMPYMAAGGSSLLANYILAALLIVISNSANKPEPDDELSTTMQYQAMVAINNREATRQREEANAAHRTPRALRTSSSDNGNGEGDEGNENSANAGRAADPRQDRRPSRGRHSATNAKSGWLAGLTHPRRPASHGNNASQERDSSHANNTTVPAAAEPEQATSAFPAMASQPPAPAPTSTVPAAPRTASNAAQRNASGSASGAPAGNVSATLGIGTGNSSRNTAQGGAR
ncbi:FtsW/RodA/SpoVE family cell cycle protein [Bifidobacterium sp. ESL0763]|uniref:FtsW/RodA/SpoVE family cell cycle protein n=1 Tax=Bifidobacterium sp. ESL0763 TaxID=2983227 RepID=UPI0023F62046|nr:FtsW/RodA/SpoVE family cell cycle protein [Bifidobacterium sp. ESL0763]MDF7663158.1 FtsW/RodA/SpoVE family cell cycle protein [Bifidobacterium sp. ESL0763]